MHYNITSVCVCVCVCVLLFLLLLCCVCAVCNKINFISGTMSTSEKILNELESLDNALQYHWLCVVAIVVVVVVVVVVVN